LLHCTRAIMYRLSPNQPFVFLLLSFSVFVRVCCDRLFREQAAGTGMGTGQDPKDILTIAKFGITKFLTGSTATNHVHSPSTEVERPIKSPTHFTESLCIQNGRRGHHDLACSSSRRQLGKKAIWRKCLFVLAVCIFIAQVQGAN